MTAHEHHHSAGTTEVAADVLSPAASWLRREPVVAATIAIAAVPLAALIVELADGSTDPVVSILLATALALVNAIGAVARRAVTPTAAPRLARDVVLVPEIEIDDDDD
jgi:hypothetical protein